MKNPLIALSVAVSFFCQFGQFQAKAQQPTNCNPTNCVGIVCPATIIKDCTLITGLGYGAMVTLPSPVLTNRCGGQVPTGYRVICNPLPGQAQFFPPGVHTVVCCVEYPDGSYRDCCCYRIVVLGNNCPPPATNCQIRLECPTNLIVCVTNQPGARVFFADVKISNPCNVATVVTYSMPSGSQFPVGKTTVSVCVDWTDPATGRKQTECCCFDVIIRCCDQPCQPDIVPPTIRCPTNILVLSPNCVPIPVTYSAPVVVDNCDPNPKVTCTPPSGSVFPIGTTKVVCCAVDHTGNSNCCEFTVTVRCPPTPPPTNCVEVICPEDIVVNCAGPNGAIVRWESRALNTCTGQQLPVTCGPPSGSFFPPGVTTVCCTNITGGVVTRCCFRVTVSNVPDTTPPTIICPSNIIILCATSNGARVKYTVVVRDDCDTNVTLTCTPPPGSLFPMGCTTVSCIAVDRAGNQSQCTFKVCLVPKGCYLRNPSFETVSPNAPPPDPCNDLVDLAPPWRSLLGTPNLFRPAAGVPVNCRGQENPCEGKNYAGLEGGYTTTGGFVTESMIGQLVAPLPNGKRFRLRACLSLAESSPGPVIIEFVLANWANPAQQQVIHRERVTQKVGWQTTLPVPACFLVPQQGVWDALIIRAGQVPAGVAPYQLGFVYLDNVNICCCTPGLTTGSPTRNPNGNTLRLQWEGDGVVRVNPRLDDPQGWMELGSGETDEMDMHTHELMIDSFSHMFFDLQIPELNSFFDVFPDGLAPSPLAPCPTCP